MDDIEDDDFGELYADVEVKASSAVGAVTALEQVPPATAAGLATSGDSVSPGELNRSEEDDDDCDSEDDLNIVLNDEDCDGIARNGSAGGSADDENGVNGDDHTSFNVPCGLAWAKHLKTTELIGGPYEDNWDDYNKENSCTARARGPVSSFAQQSGYNFTLPRYRSIFHVNIDAFKEKPWTCPGADVTDFFNFGLNEETWKTYCNSLEQLRQQTSLRTRLKNFKSSEHSKVIENEMYQDEYVKGDTANWITQRSGQWPVSHSEKFQEREASELTMKKGRPIEVEDISEERQPSMILKRARSLESDVVIQIPLQECPEEFSSSGVTDVECPQDNAHETSENGVVNAENGEVSRYYLDGKVGISKDICSPKRHSRKSIVCNLNSNDRGKENISSLNDDIEDTNLQNPNGSVETLKSVNINEGVDQSTNVADLCLMENEASPLGWTKLTLSSSLFESDSEASDESISVDHGNSHVDMIKAPQRDKSESSSASQRKNFASCRAKPARKRNYPKQRTLNREEKYCSRMQRDSSKYKVVNGDVAFPTSDYGGLSDWDYWRTGCNRWSERKLNIDRYNKELSSYYSRKRGRGEETLTDNVRDIYKEVAYCKGESMLQDDMDSNTKKYFKEREIFGGRRYKTDKKDQKWDFCAQRQRKYSNGNDSFTYRDRRHFMLHHYSDTCIETYSLSRLNSEDIRLKSESSRYGHTLGDEYDNDVRQDTYGRRFSFRDLDQVSFDRKSRTEVLNTAEVRKSGKRGGFSSFEDGSLDVNFEDGHPGSRDWGSSSYQPQREVHAVERRWNDLMPSWDESRDSQASRRYRWQKRTANVDERRDSGFAGACNAVDGPNYAPSTRKTRNNSKSELDHLSEDELFSGHEDDAHWIEEASGFYRSSSHGTNHVKRVSCGEIFDKSMSEKLDLHKTMTEEGGAFHINNDFHVIDKIKGDRAIPCSRVSVDLSFKKGKSSRSDRGRKFTHCATPESEDPKVFQRDIAMKSDSVNVNTAHEENNKQWVGKFPVREQNEHPEEIEEGQIVGDEPVADTDLVKKKMPGSEKATNRNEGITDGLDEKRLMETLAKMEKRKERFKEPATQAKEPEGKTYDQVDTKAETTADAKVQRPARKRRWVGK